MRKAEIVLSSRIIIMDVRISLNVKAIIHKPVNVLRGGNVSMYKALLE